MIGRPTIKRYALANQLASQFYDNLTMVDTEDKMNACHLSEDLMTSVASMREAVNTLYESTIDLTSRKEDSLLYGTYCDELCSLTEHDHSEKAIYTSISKENWLQTTEINDKLVEE